MTQEIGRSSGEGEGDGVEGAYAAASEAEEDAEGRQDDGEQDFQERTAPAGRHRDLGSE